MQNYTIGIDASNLRGGGGVTHLIQLLDATNPKKFNIEKIIVWGSSNTLDKLPNKTWLIKRYVKILDKALPYRIFWQQLCLPRQIRKSNCDVLFSPGGTMCFTVNIPQIVMSRNLLPFEKDEYSRYSKFSLRYMKMIILKRVQSISMSKADGVIFLSEYANKIISSNLKVHLNNSIVIPHGINKRFLYEPKIRNTIDDYSYDNPFRILYVSTIDMYKHQWNVAKAVSLVREQGIPVTLEFIGSAYGPALNRLKTTIEDIDNGDSYIHYKGKVPFETLNLCYHKSDLFIFASSCENLPNILLESMASGLPIASSSKGPMPEVLGDAGIYFDPESVEDIRYAIEKLINDENLRNNLSKKAYERAQRYSWEKCSDETFKYLIRVISK